MTHLWRAILLLSSGAAGALVAAVWQGIVLVVVVSVALRSLPKIPAATRSLIWTAVFFLVSLLHFTPAVQSVQAVRPAQAMHLLRVDAGWSLLVVALWVGLSMLRGWQLMSSVFYLRRIARRASSISSATALKMTSRSVDLCVSADLDRPSVVGFFRPRILLPTCLLDRISAQELEQILIHENEHVRRADHWMNLFQKICLVLFPINPALFWIERRLCLERELACDDQVLKTTGDYKTYARCLTNLAEYSNLQRATSLALGAYGRQSELAGRVHRILRHPRTLMKRSQIMAVTACLLIGLLGAAAALSRSPRVINFSVTPENLQAARNVNSAQPHATHISKPGTFQPALVNASAHVERPARLMRTQQRRLHQAASQTNSTEGYRMPRQWVVLTNWNSYSEPPRLTLTLSQPSPSSYAAVRMANGWLIFQL